MIEPTKGAAKGTKVDDLLYTLRALRWTDIAAANGQDAARYGLDAPTLEVALFRGDGSEIATVQVGKREDATAYADRRPAGHLQGGRADAGGNAKSPQRLQGMNEGKSAVQMRREVFVVARDRPDLYRYLSQTFADAKNVEVIWDRRTDERRRTAEGDARERRQRERRRRLAADDEIRRVGYVFLTVE